MDFRGEENGEYRSAAEERGGPVDPDLLVREDCRPLGSRGRGHRVHTETRNEEKGDKAGLSILNVR